MQQLGSWFNTKTSWWSERLEQTPNNVIQKTGMNRNELKKLLTYLDEQGIIR
jgi:transcription initiation factor IIE alpha subunit